MTYLKLDNERIIHLYVNESLSLKKVGEIVGCSDYTVKNRLLSAGISLRKRGSGGAPSFVDTYREKFDVPGIVHAYCVEQKSAQTVGKEFGCSSPTIQRILKKEGVPIRTISEAMRLKHQRRRENSFVPESSPLTPLGSSEITVSLEAGLGERTVDASDSIEEMREAGLRIDQIAEIKGITPKGVYDVIYGGIQA